MRNFRLNFLLSLGISLFTCGLLTSCTDNTYDLSNVDMTMGFGLDSITLPSNNSTEAIRMDEVLRLNNSKFVVIQDNGDYAISFNDGKKLSASSRPVPEYVNGSTRTVIPHFNHGYLGTINLGRAPEFMEASGAVINLNAPIINLNIITDTPDDVSITGTLVGKDKDGNILSSVDLPPFKIPANKNSIVSLRKQKLKAKGDTITSFVQELSNLFERIPHSIDITNVVAIGEATNADKVKMDFAYTISTTYKIEAPLAFDEGSSIVYEDSFSGWNESLKDISFIGESGKLTSATQNYLKMEAEVENRVPLYMVFSGNGIDNNGNLISSEELSIEPNQQIAPSENGVSPSHTHLILTLRPKNNEVFKKLNGIKLFIKGYTNDPEGKGKPMTNIVLNAKSQTISLTNIRTTIVGKLVGNFN